MYAIDLGTTFTKDSGGNIFPSGISETIYPNANTLKIDNKVYSMERNTGLDTNINKGMNKNTRLNFIYSLAKMTRYQDTNFNNVMVGLPCSQWKNEKTVEQFKSYLWDREVYEIQLNGMDISIEIDNLDVIPEGSTAYYSKLLDNKRFNGRKVLLIDWGGLTVNQVLYDNDNYIDCHTEELGVLKVYQKMAQEITCFTGKDIKYSDMFDILRFGLTIDGKLLEIEPIIKPIALETCEELYQSLKLRWGVSTIPYVECLGASFIPMIQYFQGFIPHAELTKSPQTIAVQGMIDMMEVDE